MNKARLLPVVEETLKQYGITYKILECAPDLADTAAFCEEYGFSLSQSANTILITSRKREPPKYAICVVLATSRLDVNKRVCALLEAKKASFADAETTANLTGMMIGGVTAVGVNGLPIYIDSAVAEQTEVVMGGGNRSSKILLNPKELTKLPTAVVVEGLARPKE